MAENLHFTGYIKGVKYKACLTEKLVKTREFDINQASAYGINLVDEFVKYLHRAWLLRGCKKKL